MIVSYVFCLTSIFNVHFVRACPVAAPTPQVTPVKSNTTQKTRPAATAPTAPKFAVGAAIEARWNGGAKYYRGKIVKLNLDGTYGIHYNDGDKAASVVASHIRPVRPPKRNTLKRNTPKSKVENASAKANSLTNSLTNGLPKTKKAELSVGYKVTRNERHGFIKKIHPDSTVDIQYYNGLEECNIHAHEFQILSKTVDGRVQPTIDAEAVQANNRRIVAHRMTVVRENIEQKSKKSLFNLFGLFS